MSQRGHIICRGPVYPSGEEYRRVRAWVARRYAGVWARAAWWKRVVIWRRIEGGTMRRCRGWRDPRRLYGAR